MNKTVFRLFAVIVLCAAMSLIYACGGRGSDQDDEELAPFLYEESFEIFPEPAQLYEKAEFYLGWKDHDGNMENPVVTVRLVNEAGTSIILDAEDVDVEPDKNATAGSLSFTVLILDEYQGDYYVQVSDDEGNQSNTISRFLYVNTEPTDDEF